MKKFHIKDHKDLFKYFGKDGDSISVSANKPLEEVIIAFAEHYQDSIKPGHGMFFDFKATPELEKPVLDYLIKGFGWTLERPYFIRKPK